MTLLEQRARVHAPRRPALEWIGGHEWIVLAYLLVSVGLAALFDLRMEYGLAFDFRYDGAFLNIVLLVLVLYLSATGVSARWSERDATPFGPSWRARMRCEVFTWQRVYDLARAVVLLKLVLVIYCNVKQSIPRLNPALFDAQLLRADVALHLGWDPNSGTPALLGHPWIARTFDALYAAWYAVKAPVVVLFVLVRDRRLQMRFFGAYFALWIVGGLCAVLAPSLGPVYTHPEWYADLAKPTATRLQAQLWTHYQEALAHPEDYGARVYEGIAAFPSLHVAVVALFAFFLYRVDRRLGWAMFAYTIVVQVGSVLLGWHYAVDGYFGILLAYLLFRTSDRWTRLGARTVTQSA